MRTLKYYKTKKWMIITILLIQIILPTLNVIIGNAFTVKSSTVGVWNISKTEEDNVKAGIDAAGNLTITGTGKMKDWTNSEAVPWNKENITVKKVVIKEGVTSIGQNAFYNTAITSVELPESLKNIGERAFFLCKNISKIELPEGVTEIGTCAFTDCSNLKTIKIPNGVTKISDSLFYNCTSLTDVEISDQVTSIGARAFYNCTNLSNIELSNELKDIGYAAFYGCTNLKSIIIPEGVTRIESWLFGNCKNIEKIVIPAKVKEIAIYALYSCTNVTIYCNKGSYSETYAKESDIKYKTDDNKPVIENVTGNPTKLTDNDVTLKVEAKDSEVGLAINPYSFDNGKTWQKENTKTYSKNTKGIVIKVKDALGNIAIYETINITKIKKLKIEIAEDTNISNGKSYIHNLKPNTNISKLLDSITTNGEIKVYQGEREITDKTKKIATGMEIKITLNEESQNYLLIVTGDVNGDAKADLSDILAINKHRLNKVDLMGENLLAGDVNNDGKADLNDILQINKFRLGKIENL